MISFVLKGITLSLFYLQRRHRNFVEVGTDEGSPRYISTRYIVRICIKRTWLSIEYGYTDAPSHITLGAMVHALLLTVVIILTVIVIVAIVFVMHTRRLQRHGMRHAYHPEERKRGGTEKQGRSPSTCFPWPRRGFRDALSREVIKKSSLGNFSACFTSDPRTKARRVLCRSRLEALRILLSADIERD